jgi:hypothetical protein
MIIWSGLGFLVAVVVFALSLIANLIINVTLGDGYYTQHRWPLALSLLGSALVCWFLGDHLRKRSGRVVIDKQTGKEFVVNQSQHTLFFVPMHWWGPLLGGIAMVVFAWELFG